MLEMGVVAVTSVEHLAAPLAVGSVVVAKAWAMVEAAS